MFLQNCEKMTYKCFASRKEASKIRNRPTSEFHDFIHILWLKKKSEKWRKKITKENESHCDAEHKNKNHSKSTHCLENFSFSVAFVHLFLLFHFLFLFRRLVIRWNLRESNDTIYFLAFCANNWFSCTFNIIQGSFFFSGLPLKWESLFHRNFHNAPETWHKLCTDWVKQCSL